MAAALKPLLAGTSVALETVDIDNAPALKARFDCEVPLLFEGEVEILRHEFDATAFDAWLREVRLAGPALHSL